MTIEDACRHAGIGRTKMIELINDGLVDAVAEPRRLVFVESLEEYLRNCPRKKKRKGPSTPGPEEKE